MTEHYIGNDRSQISSNRFVFNFMLIFALLLLLNEYLFQMLCVALLIRLKGKREDEERHDSIGGLI